MITLVPTKINSLIGSNQPAPLVGSSNEGEAYIQGCDTRTSTTQLFTASYFTRKHTNFSHLSCHFDGRDQVTSEWRGQ